MGGGGVSDVEAVRDIHITSYFSPVSNETITLRNFGFIRVLLQEAWPVNLTARNLIYNTVHQKASTNPESQSGTTANEKGKGRK